jgi:hypothetical protein
VSFDRSEVATERVRLLIKISISCPIFRFSRLGVATVFYSVI